MKNNITNFTKFKIGSLPESEDIDQIGFIEGDEIIVFDKEKITNNPNGFTKIQFENSIFALRNKLFSKIILIEKNEI